MSYPYKAASAVGPSASRRQRPQRKCQSAFTSLQLCWLHYRVKGILGRLQPLKELEHLAKGMSMSTHAVGWAAKKGFFWLERWCYSVGRKKGFCCRRGTPNVDALAVLPGQTREALPAQWKPKQQYAAGWIWVDGIFEFSLWIKCFEHKIVLVGPCWFQWGCRDASENRSWAYIISLL